MSIYFPPVQIDPTTNGVQENGNFSLNNQTSGPFLYNGALYVVLLPVLNPSGTIDVWKSTDGGQTWATVDHAHAVQGGVMTSAFDGNQTIGVCLTPANNITSWNFNCIFFDLATQTWGSLSAPSSFSANGNPLFMTFLPGGGNFIAFTNFVASKARVNGVIFSAGGFGASFLVDANAVAAVTNPDGAYNATLGVTDSAGNTHCFMGIFNAASALFMFYQQVGPAGVLGAFFQFPNVGTVLNGATFGVPCIQGTNLVFPVGTLSGADNRTGVYIGAGLSVPVWTLFPDIDPGMVGSAQTQIQCAALIGGAVQIVAMWPVGAFSNGLFRLSATTDFVHWVFTTVTAYDIVADGPPAFQVGGSQYISCPAITPQGLAVEAVNAANTADARFFFQNLAGPAPTTFGISITLRGVKRYKCEPGEDGPQVTEVPTLPSVKRAV